MFTNWLTGSTGLPNCSSTSTNRLTESSSLGIPITNPPAGLSSLLTSNSIANLNTNIMSSPPDIILEVGPAPTTMRFMAHGHVLGMHSGYLRSAIRLDERSGGSSTSVVVANSTDIIVYLTNVTAEQFAPLLTYMYTGYLDLNVENIFGVLLATHVLHMPRALEICRSYLARAQTEGYFAPNNNSLNTTTNHQSLTNSGKIIRPIASKPQLANFGFLPMSHAIGGLNNIPTNTQTNTQPQETKCSSNNIDDCNKSEEDIEVDELDKLSVNNENHLRSIHDDDDEDIEVFIDTTSEAEVIVETDIKKLSFKKIFDSKKQDKERESSSKSKHEKSHHKKSHKSERRRKSSSGLQVAKAPIPASQLDTSEANKVIIDVASCDGPVRFKRILNTAYGHKPELCVNPANQSGIGNGMVPQERSLQSVSLSFHQQMAKTISQQQQLHQAEESENSETSNGSNGGGGGVGGIGGLASSSKTNASRKIQSEIFVCVYCKHTFKSQYCYQKHAKRHLNPLTLQATCVGETKREHNEDPSATANGELQITKHQNITNTRPFFVRNSTHFSTPSSSAGTTSNSLTHQQHLIQGNAAAAALPSTSSTSDYLRREVRPLDMNVQYYPCKTCGSKFPSYYFVHKHRKMCHAEEEAAAAAQQSSDIRGDSTLTTTSTPVIVNDGEAAEDECLNSKNSD